jgi:hypothetical protein
VLCSAEIGRADAERADSYFLNEPQLADIEALAIAPSDDPWVLFEAFAKRLSVVTPPELQRSPRDIRRLAEAGGGDGFALAFVLLNLFRWNGIDPDLVFLSTERHSEHSDRLIERALVYVPALKQYFDPLLPVAGQPDSADRTWLAGRGRMHFFAALLQHNGKAIGRCLDLCLYATGGPPGSGMLHDPYARRITTIRVPVMIGRDGGHSNP